MEQQAQDFSKIIMKQNATKANASRFRIPENWVNFLVLKIFPFSRRISHDQRLSLLYVTRFPLNLITRIFLNFWQIWEEFSDF